MAITKFTDVADSGYDIAINRDTAHQTERDKFLAGLVTKIDELTDLINTHITDMAANNAKTTFPGFGTSSTTALVGNTALLQVGTTSKTALAGNTTTISTSQASAITANTAKTSMVIGKNANEAMAGNTAIPNVTVTSDRGLVVNFGNLVPGKTSGATVELTITDHNQKSAPTYTAVITLK
tara:strand:+ start:519 stop:1061 length:543 start_codon:yes stop_codon:yes gene_type:complete